VLGGDGWTRFIWRACREAASGLASRIQSVFGRGNRLGRDLENDMGSCSIVIRCSPNWSPNEIAQAEQKARDLDAAAQKGALVKTNVAGSSRSQSAAYRRRHMMEPGTDVDHIIDLQVGGISYYRTAAPGLMSRL
jgi:hypothetical protein